MSNVELPINEWIVIFYPTTGVTRLCPTLDFAHNHISKNSYKHIYRNASDFRVKHDHALLEKCWVNAHKNAAWMLPKSATGNLEDYSKEPPDLSTEEFAKALWGMLQDIGDRLTAPTMAASTKTKENYELKFSKMNELIGDEGTFKEKYNKQARTVFLALFNHGKQFLLEEEIKGIIYRLVADRQLKTKQKPWTIFQYYRPQFINDGYIVRGRAKKQ